jgi:transcription initiation factor TFIIB
MTESTLEETIQSANQVIIELDLSEGTHTRCMNILKDSRTKDILTERNADGIIAGAVYIAAILTDNRLTQQSLADMMDISEATIRKYYVKLVKMLKLKKTKKKG